MRETEVAVVGAGPVGLTAAALLAARGVDVVLFERNRVTSDEPKAISIDDEALRVFQWAGLAERIMKIIVPGTGTRYYGADGQPVFQARAARPMRFGYPFKNPFAQPDLERELFDHLAAHPRVRLRMGTEVTGVRQLPDGVLAETADGSARARYLLGCDGGRSTVRETLGIGMRGRSYSDVWLVADVLGDHHDERYGMHHGDPHRPHVIIPGGGGRCRYEFLLRPGEGEPGVPPDFAMVRHLLSGYRDITADQVERAVNYRFHAVVAQRWRDGRVFLLGDAAHMMPPFAGQGLNSGIRDAANLSWKLVEVLANRLTDAALDSYQAERRPHAEAVVRLSERLGRVVMSTNPRFAQRRDRVVRRALRTEHGRDFFEQMRFRPAHAYSNGLLVPGAPAVGTAVGQPRVFDTATHRIRSLDDVLGPGWALLGVDVPATELTRAAASVAPLSPVLAHVPMDERMPASRGTLRALVDVDGQLAEELAGHRGRFVLLRPDRFVAASWAPGQATDLAGPLCWATCPELRSA